MLDHPCHNKQIRQIACVLHPIQYKSHMNIYRVRKLLGWGQTKDKDNALYQASIRVEFFGSLKTRLTVAQLDDNDIGWLAVVVDNENMIDLSERLRNSKRTGQLLLHNQHLLTRCGPNVINDKRIWLSAIACQTDTVYPYFRVSTLRNDTGLRLSFYISTYKDRRSVKPYNRAPASSSIECLEIYLEDVKMKMTELEQKISQEQRQIDALDKWNGDKDFGRSLQQAWKQNKLWTLERMMPLQTEYQVICDLMIHANSRSMNQ